MEQKRSKTPLVMTIIFTVLAVIAAGLFAVLLPLVVTGTDIMTWLTTFGTGLWQTVVAMVTFQGGSAIGGIWPKAFSISIIVMLAVFAIAWIWHLVTLIVKRRPGALVTNLLFLVFGAVLCAVAMAYMGWQDTNTAFMWGSSRTGIHVAVDSFKSGDIMKGIWVALPGGIAFIAYIFGLIAIGTSIHSCRVHSGLEDGESIGEIAQEEEEERIVASAQQRWSSGEKESRKERRAREKREREEAKKAEQVQKKAQDDNKAPVALNNKSEDKNVDTKVLTPWGNGGPIIVQNFNNGSLYGSLGGYNYEQSGSGAQHPHPEHHECCHHEHPDMPKPLSEEDIRKIFAEEIKKVLAEVAPAPAAAPEAAPAPVVEETPVVKEEAKPAPADNANRLLTAKELRAIIQDELRDHDHPEELRPLTDDECRKLIREELDEYYGEGEVQGGAETCSCPKDESSSDDESVMTAEELTDLIKEEVNNALKEDSDTLTEDDIKRLIAEEVAASHVETGLTSDEVRVIVKEELAASSIDSAHNANDEEALAVAKEAKDTALDSQYNSKATALKQSAEIDDVKRNQLSTEQVRTLVNKELDKRLGEISKKKEETVKEELEAATPIIIKETIIKEEPKPAPAPAPVAAPAGEEEDDEEKGPKQTFASRVLSADDELKENYNELKAEILSYGLKSRLSISGDTFRLHTKTYVKIVVAGKGLKLYMALDPNDYKDSTIPVKDAGHKNIYKDIPLVFKVKSPLSLKRAKSLIADVCTADGFTQGEIPNRDYAAQLEYYKIAGTEDEDED